MDLKENPNDFDRLVNEAAHAHFSGWDFSFLNQRLVEGDPCWNYRNIVIDNLWQATAVLDLGTGGGEFLSNLPNLPVQTCATEGWPPNLEIARQRLEPSGIKVVDCSNDDHLPFENETFDLIISRHESFSASEIYRILKPAGRFITQQVGGKDNDSLNLFLAPQIKYPFSHWNLEFALEQLSSAGFKIVDQQEDYPVYKFMDIGAVVYYLKVIEWQIPGFNLHDYRDKLLELHHYIKNYGCFESRSHRFLIVAIKPGDH